VLWGVLGPKAFFGGGSAYSFLYYAFAVGPALVIAMYFVHKRKPHWQVETRFNPVLILSGGVWFPIYQTANLFTSALASGFL
jgi:hypothetical protein